MMRPLAKHLGPQYAGNVPDASSGRRVLRRRATAAVIFAAWTALAMVIGCGEAKGPGVGAAQGYLYTAAPGTGVLEGYVFMPAAGSGSLVLGTTAAPPSGYVPAPGATVNAYAYVPTTQGRARQTATADRRGYYIITDLPLGQYTVVATLAGFGPGQQVQTTDQYKVIMSSSPTPPSGFRPAAGAAIQFADLTTVVTDSDGYFSAAALQPGLHTVTITIAGFPPITMTVLVEDGSIHSGGVLLGR